MLRFFLRLCVLLTSVLAFLVIACAVVSRGLQTALPSVAYSKSLTLYVTQPGCASLLEICAREGHKLLDNLYTLPVATWSPGGKSVAVHRSDHWAFYPTSCLSDNLNCKPALLDPTINDARIAWGPDGSLVAFLDSADATLTVMTRGCWDGSPPASCIRRSVPITTFSIVGQQDWSADGRTLVFVNRVSSGFVLLDLACLDDAAGCGQYLRLLPASQTPVAWPSLSADGTQLLYHADTSGQGNHEALFILNTITDETRQITFRAGASLNADWSSSGRYIVFSGYAAPRSRELSLYVIDLERGLTALLLHEPKQSLEYPVWDEGQ